MWYLTQGSRDKHVASVSLLEHTAVQCLESLENKEINSPLKEMLLGPIEAAQSRPDDSRDTMAYSPDEVRQRPGY